MSDDDRLADYLARMDNPNHARDLDDGCRSCAHSLVFCNCVKYIESQPCCDTCTH